MGRFVLSSAVFLALLHICYAVSLNYVKRWDDFKTKHAWAETPKNWELVGSAPADSPLQLKIGLKQDRFEELVEHLYEVSDPTHSRYGAHLSKEEVDALVAPHSDSVNLVNSWLAHHNVDTDTSVTRSSAGDWFSVTVTIGQAEKMLNTKYNTYKHLFTSETIVRAMNYSLPSVIHSHVDLVTPTTYFGTIEAMKSTSFIVQYDPVLNSAGNGDLALASCNSTITPTCLKDLYNFANYTPSAIRNNSFGIAGYLDQYPNYSDLQEFFSNYSTQAIGTNFTLVSVNGGGNNQSMPGVEANLDIQYTEGLSFPTPNIFYSVGGSPPFIPDAITPTNTNEPYLYFLDYILSQKSIPQTFTTSYGDDEQTVPQDYAIKVCDLFAQLGARGSSVMFSSGDFGVGGGKCLSNDGKNTTKFLPIFPASCPFVTSVGGTIGIYPERAVFFSGGGFSDYFPRPAYQEFAVAGFLARLGNTYSGLYNASGRGFPDVAAQGYNFSIIYGGRRALVGGTSASSPTFSSVITLLNDYRISNGRSSLGFLNPMLYLAGWAGLNDITIGSNPGCNTTGFPAVTGWDPVTGLGTPDFGRLQPIVLSFP